MMYHCKEHGDWDANKASGCPDCVAEMRQQLRDRDARIAELESLHERTGEENQAMNSRKEFESWCAARWGGDSEVPTLDPDSGEYILGHVQFAWSAWSARDARFVWPKSRDVGRYGDMDQGSYIGVGLDAENDCYVIVHGRSLEFCTVAGGGRSPRTREALIALMVAIEADNAETPAKDWWARRTGQATKP